MNGEVLLHSENRNNAEIFSTEGRKKRCDKDQRLRINLASKYYHPIYFFIIKNSFVLKPQRHNGISFHWLILLAIILVCYVEFPWMIEFFLVYFFFLQLFYSVVKLNSFAAGFFHHRLCVYLLKVLPELNRSFVYILEYIQIKYIYCICSGLYFFWILVSSYRWYLSGGFRLVSDVMPASKCYYFQIFDGSLLTYRR